MKKMIITSSLICLFLAFANISALYPQSVPASNAESHLMPAFIDGKDVCNLNLPDHSNTAPHLLKSEKASGPLYRFTVAGADALIHGLTVGRGKGANDSNTALGVASLYNNNGGIYNTAVALGVLFNNTTGQYNTSMGYWSMLSNTSGSRNTAYGAGSMLMNSIGEKNTAVGYSSLGTNNGSNNTGIGYETLAANEGGQRNTAIGSEALRNNSVGGWNVAIGSIALQMNTSGEDNVAIGADALKMSIAASGNVAVGSFTLGNNESGSNNTAVGRSAGRYRNNLSYCTFIGYNAYPTAGSLFNITAIGYNARPTKSNQMVFGNANITEIGGVVNWSIVSDGTFKKNIREDVAGLDFIMLLRPVTYNYDVYGLDAHLNKNAPVEEEDGRAARGEWSEEAIKAAEQKAAIVYSGFVAQEVEAAARALNYDFSGVNVPETDDEYYSLSYAEFVVPIVKAIQEQQQQIEVLEPGSVAQLKEEVEWLMTRNESLEQQIKEVKAMLEAMLLQQDDEMTSLPKQPSEVTGHQHHTAHLRASLEQNAPNPFQEQTVIRYFLPEDSGNAQIVITDMNGIQLKSIELYDRGAGQVMLNGQSLMQGQYIYSLVVRGRLADSKRMVIF